MVENGLIIKNCVLSKITNRFKEIVGLFKILPRRKIFRQIVPEKFQWNAFFHSYSFTKTPGEAQFAKITLHQEIKTFC